MLHTKKVHGKQSECTSRLLLGILRILFCLKMLYFNVEEKLPKHVELVK